MQRIDSFIVWHSLYSRVVIESVISRAKYLYTILHTKIKTTFMTLKIVDNTK